MPFRTHDWSFHYFQTNTASEVVCDEGINQQGEEGIGIVRRLLLLLLLLMLLLIHGVGFNVLWLYCTLSLLL
jgi:hypothetical protein